MLTALKDFTVGAEPCEHFKGLGAPANDTDLCVAASVRGRYISLPNRFGKRIRASSLRSGYYGVVGPQVPLGGGMRSGWHGENGTGVLDPVYGVKSVMGAL